MLVDAAAEAAGVPRSMLRQILAAMHEACRADLVAAGIPIAELPR
jgi:hypothetical protein